MPAVRDLAWDFSVFVQILFYWVLMFVLIAPLRLLDRLLGTRTHRPLDLVTRWIARL